MINHVYTVLFTKHFRTHFLIRLLQLLVSYYGYYYYYLHLMLRALKLSWVKCLVKS